MIQLDTLTSGDFKPETTLRASDVPSIAPGAALGDQMFTIQLIAPNAIAGERIATCSDRNESLSLADRLFNEMRKSGHAVSGSIITVLPDGQKVPIASVTDGRILGTFNKQVWGGRKGDDAILIGTEDFDATDYILRMDISAIRELADHSCSTDAIGSAHVDHDGPCEVDITGTICTYFGIDQLQDLTEEHLQFVRERVGALRQAEANSPEQCLSDPVKALADALNIGVDTDIWYDAGHHNDEAAQETIESFKVDIGLAAQIVTLMSSGIEQAIAHLGSDSVSAAMAARASLEAVRDEVKSILPVGYECSGAQQDAPATHDAAARERARVDEVFNGLAESLKGMVEYYPTTLGNEEIRDALLKDLRANFAPTGNNQNDYRRLCEELESSIERLPGADDEDAPAPAP